MKSVRESIVRYKRIETPELSDIKRLTSADHVQRFLNAIWEADQDLVERFYAIYVNNANQPIAFSLISMGGITGTVVDVRVIFQQALLNGATGLILAHNHPSGNLKPSGNDEAITRKIKSAGELFDIKVLDHLIMSPDGNYYSFANEGLL